MNSLGIYFGIKSINIVEVKERKYIKSVIIPQTAIPASQREDEQKVPVDLKNKEIASLIADALLKNNISTKTATLALSGKDLIIRSFEIPLVPRAELASVISFEARKYIPFKMEELLFDYHVQYSKASRTNYILFIAVKKKTLENYLYLFDQLNLKLDSIEYSAFSTKRLFNIAKVPDKDVVALLGIDLEEEDEMNFTVLENGFPLFSRDISLAVEHSVLPSPSEDKAKDVLGKLKAEIRVSLDYYNRKFPNKSVKKLFFFSNVQQRPGLEAFLAELGLSASFIDVAKSIDASFPYSLSLVKAYTASLSKAIKNNLTANRLLIREKLTGLAGLKGKEAPFDFAIFIKGIRFDSKAIELGIIVCLIVFGVGFYRLKPLQEEIKNIIAARQSVTTVNTDASYEELEKADSEYTRKVNSFNSLITRKMYLTEGLNIIARLMPTSMWLEDFNYNESNKAGEEFILQGSVYLEDAEKEFDVVNDFVSKLKKDQDFGKYFSTITRMSMEHAQVDNLSIARFSIICKAGQKKD